MIPEKNLLQFNLRDQNHILSLIANTLDCKVEFIKIPTESAISFYTSHSKEILVIVEGNGGIVINGNSSLVKNGDIIHVPANSVRSLSNVETQDLQVISIRSA